MLRLNLLSDLTRGGGGGAEAPFTLVVAPLFIRKRLAACCASLSLIDNFN